MRGHGSQWISNKINIRHPLQLKKSFRFCLTFSIYLREKNICMYFFQIYFTFSELRKSAMIASQPSKVHLSGKQQNVLMYVFRFLQHKILYNQILGIIKLWRAALIFSHLCKILISKQTAPAFLFSFQLRIKTPFRKYDSVIFFMEVKCKGKTQITHMEETKNRHQVIRLMAKFRFSRSFYFAKN